MKKSFPWFAFAIATLSLVLWGVAQVTRSQSSLAALFPDNALLYIEAKDFQSLLSDWNSSEEKRAWIKGDNYSAFSRSRLFERLSQAQTEFSTAAFLSADDTLLTSVSGAETALAVYDIGNLQFVYVTRMAQPRVEASPLWQLRDKFEQRTEGSAHFYVHVDLQSNRTAAFAARDGWLILGTREDLVAGVLDRLQGGHSLSLPDEPWYADSLKQASSQEGDLRMVLNLERLVPSPYFRSYWVQRNITEMKQYRAAVSDLFRGPEAYREERILLRRPGIASSASGDITPLLSIAPAEAVFSSAQASPETDHVLMALRENLLEVQSAQQQSSTGSAPALATAEDAGSASALEERIDIAPVIAAHVDAYQQLRALLAEAQPSALLETYTTRSNSGDMFVAINRGVVLVSPSPWNEPSLQIAISAALRANLTASQLGIEWTPQTGANGATTSLNGQLSLHMAVRGNHLFLADSASLLDTMLLQAKQAAPSQANSVTYSAVFQHNAREQQNFQQLYGKLDTAAHGIGDPTTDAAAGETQSPPFFSGNIASLSRMFAHVDRETIEEHDKGTLVTQTVVYRWRHS